MAKLTWSRSETFFSYLDEKAFFTWLESIGGVTKVVGTPEGLVINLRSSRPSEQSLRDLLAIYARYNGEMKELAQFLTPKNAGWFKNPKAYWFKRVFGA